jgi:WD40-like Beta Propeller Repeat
MNIDQKGTQVNHTTSNARTPLLRTGFSAALPDSSRGGGSGAPSSGVTAGLRLAGLVALTIALVALSVGSASAATVNPKIGEISEAFTGSTSAVSVAVNDKNGHIYVADSGARVIRDYTSASDPSPVEWTGSNVPAGEFLGTLDVAVENSTGDVYVSDSSAALIYKFDQNGNLIAGFGDHENGGSPEPDGSLAGLQTPAASFLPALFFGFGIAVDQASGNLYAIDAGHEVIDVFDSTGAYLEQIASEPDAFGCGGNLTNGIAVNNDSGELLLSTSCATSTERPKVYRFELSTGAFVASIDGSTTKAESFGSLYISIAAADSSGYFYVSDASHGVVDVFGPDGSYKGRILSTPSGSQEAVAVDQASGDVYLAKQVKGATVIEIFGPTAIIPDITTLPAELHSTTSATLNGEVNPAGLPVTECFFEYGPTTTYGQTAPCEPDAAALGAGNSPAPVEAQLTSLAPGAYHYRLVAANANGANQGADEVLFTGASIDSTSVSAVSATTATLETEINPHGFPTSFHFEYVTQQHFEAEGFSAPLSTPEQSAGAGELDAARSASVGGLVPDTTYRFRVVATNSLGTVTGPDRSFTTQGAPATLLPDARGWELVSPPEKHGAALEAIGGLAGEGAVIQAANDGSAISYFASAPPDPEPAGNRSAANSQLISTPDPAGGWSTLDIATAHQAPAGFTPGDLSEYELFAADLSLAALQPPGATPLSPLATEKTPYLRQPDGAYTPLVTEANVPAGVHFGGTETHPEFLRDTVEFRTATPDLAHLLLTSPQPLTADLSAPGPESIFEWSAGQLQLASLIPPGPTTVCGGSTCIPAAEAGLRSTVGLSNEVMRGSISADGSRVVFTTNTAGELGSLYLRDLDRGETVLLDAPQEGSGGSGSAFFQLASADGSRVFFTDANRLTADSTAAKGKPDLYMCQIEVDGAGHLACGLTDLTANPAEPADVQGAVIGASADGSNLYFVAQGALTAGEGAVEGDCGFQGFDPVGQCNLYSYDLGAESTRLIAVLSGADSNDWALGGTNLKLLTARVSPNGRYLAFMSQRSLTGYDNRDAKTGVRDQEVFLYDNQGAPDHRLICPSCNPTGSRPRGIEDIALFPGLLVDRPLIWGKDTSSGQTIAANVPGWSFADTQHLLYQSRYLSASGRLFFNAADALAPSDSNGTFDVYQFEFPQGPGQPGSNNCTIASPGYSPASGGCVSLISSGTSPKESAFMDASESGDDVFFLTQSRLTGKDVDVALDLYDARVGGGEPPLVKPVECSGDACQQPAVPPNDQTPGSLTFQGAGNVLACPKGKVKKHGRCVKKHKAKKHHKKLNKKKSEKQKNQRTNANRGGAK